MRSHAAASWPTDPNDWLSTQTLANGATATYTYNALSQVTQLLNQISNNTISDFSSLVYDGIGNRTSVTASIPGATSLNGTTGYAYDTKDQVTQETSTRNSGFTDNFGYDSAGNPTSFKGVTKTYNSKNQQTASGFAYDGNGNPTTYSGTALTFDPENRMTGFGSVLTAGYNGDGLRAWKQNSSVRTYFLYDGITPIVELDSSGNVIAAPTLGSAGLVSHRTGSTSVFYSFDAEGNVTQRSDASGNILSNKLFAAHGSVLSGTVSEPFGYKAQVAYYTDNETGLQLLTHRYYDSLSGRFLTRDPIVYAGGINLYSYTSNNPISSVDPLGLELGGLYLLLRERSAAAQSPPVHQDNFDWWGAFWGEYWKLRNEACYANGGVNIGGTCMPLGTFACGFVVASGGPSFLGQESGPAIQVPRPPTNPGDSPGSGWNWRGQGSPGGPQGSWHNKGEGQSLHPHLRPSSHGPHWDWDSPTGKSFRLYPDGRLEPK
jgi:RHS repeat-associated protein